MCLWWEFLTIRFYLLLEHIFDMMRHEAQRSMSLYVFWRILKCSPFSIRMSHKQVVGSRWPRHPVWWSLHFAASVLWSAIDYCVAVIGRLPCDSGDEQKSTRSSFGAMGFVGSWDWNHYRSIMFLYSTGQIWTDPFQAPAQHDQIGPVIVNWDWTKACTASWHNDMWVHIFLDRMMPNW